MKSQGESCAGIYHFDRVWWTDTDAGFFVTGAVNRLGMSLDIWVSDEDNDEDAGGDNGDLQVVTESQEKVKVPRKYKVLLHNDDYTPMEFVIHVLMQVFRRGYDDAYRTMMHVHTKGMGIAGVYAYEVAETKVAKVMRAARENEYPLRCSMEPE